MSIVLFIFVLILFWLGYTFYGNYLSRIIGIQPERRTPAFTKYDRTDYVPAKNWSILFGHHFASIAGAGPIVGPVIAYLYWGWAGVLIWIVLGSIFFGGVHDFLSLIVSVREDGKTLGGITEKYISRRASKVFLAFLWCTLIIVISVFADVCAKTFINQPRVVIPSLGLIPIAVCVGILIYSFKSNTIFATVVGLACLGLLLVFGNAAPITLKTTHAYFIWICVLFGYTFFASILPVNILLQPRDYLSSFLLFFGLSVSVVGLVTKPLPVTNAHFFTFFSSARGPLFPMMFITVACGAISGFHSLVSSGTSSKQLASELHAKRIGYGAMVTEGILAVIALFFVAFGLKEIPQGKSPVEIFSLGFAQGVYFLGKYSQAIAIVILNTFILTTLDTATRIARFLTQELTGVNNRWITTAVVVSAGAYLGFTGKWETLWPMFGASNQLVAALVLIVLSSWLLSRKRNYKITLIPAVCMLFVTLAALIFNAKIFYQKSNYLLFSISISLILMSGFILSELKRFRVLKTQ